MTASCAGWSDGSALVFNAQLERSRLLDVLRAAGLLLLLGCAWVLLASAASVILVVIGFSASAALHLWLSAQPRGQLARRLDGRWLVPGRRGLWRLVSVRVVHARLLVLHFAGSGGLMRCRRHACLVAEDALGPVVHRQLRRWLLAPDSS